MASREGKLISNAFLGYFIATSCVIDFEGVYSSTASFLGFYSYSSNIVLVQFFAVSKCFAIDLSVSAGLIPSSSVLSFLTFSLLDILLDNYDSLDGFLCAVTIPLMAPKDCEKSIRGIGD